MVRYLWGAVLSAGYARLHGKLLYTAHVVTLDEVAESEQDDFLRLFTHRQAIRESSTVHWLQQWLIGKASNMQDVEDLEGYDEVQEKLLAMISPEKRIASLSEEQLLASIPPEKRVAGLSEEQLLASIPQEQLLASIPTEKRVAGLSADELFESLSEEQRQALATMFASKPLYSGL